jgi:hypothetical protein
MEAVMIKTISQLTNPKHGLWSVDELVTRLATANSLSESAATEIKRSAYIAINFGKLQSHDPETSLHNERQVDHTPLVTSEEFMSWLNQSGSQLKTIKPRRAQASLKKNAAVKSNWKMQIQTEAFRLFKTLRATGASPTVHSILPTIASWCRTHNVKTDGGIFPSEGYLRTHVLGGRHWSPPQ